MSLTLQYIIVCLILAAAVVIIIVRLVKLRREGKRATCCGCALSDSCNKNRNRKDCHENNQNLE